MFGGVCLRAWFFADYWLVLRGSWQPSYKKLCKILAKILKNETWDAKKNIANGAAVDAQSIKVGPWAPWAPCGRNRIVVQVPLGRFRMPFLAQLGPKGVSKLNIWHQMSKKGSPKNET